MFNCDRCSRCCTTFRVPLTFFDLRRLMDDTGVLDPSSLVQWLAPEQIDLEGEPESFFELREGRRVLVLRHVQLDPKDGGPPSACQFLAPWGCSVHRSRPDACRSYPFDRAVRESVGLRLSLVPGMQCDRATRFEEVLAADLEIDGEAAEFYRLISERDRRLFEFCDLIQRHNAIMKLRRRLGRLPWSGDEVLRHYVAAGKGPEVNRRTRTDGVR